jgi:hypothetical protein
VLGRPTLIARTIPFIPAIRFIRLQKTLTSPTGIAPPIPGRDCLVGVKVVGGEADPRVKPGGPP